MTKPRGTGLSKGVSIVCGSSFALRQSSRPAMKRVKVNRTRKELAKEKALHQAQLASKLLFEVIENSFMHDITALSFQDREDQILHENDVNMDDPAWVYEDSPALMQPPPGEEGFFSSHAGGETRLQDLFLDTLSEQ